MVAVTYITCTGEKFELDARIGNSLMEQAISAGVPGIDALCGGSGICGTCHLYVQEDWLEKLLPPGTHEEDLLANSKNTKSNSRLGCQIRLNEALEGIVVSLPAEQDSAI